MKRDKSGRGERVKRDKGLSWGEVCNQAQVSARGRANDPSFRQKKQKSLAQRMYRAWVLRYCLDVYAGVNAPNRWEQFMSDVQRRLESDEISCEDKLCDACFLIQHYNDAIERGTRHRRDSVKSPGLWLEYPERPPLVSDVSVFEGVSNVSRSIHAVISGVPRTVVTYHPRRLP